MKAESRQIPQKLVASLKFFCCHLSSHVSREWKLCRSTRK